MTSATKAMKKVATNPIGAVRLGYAMSKQYWSPALKRDARHFSELARQGKRGLFLDGGSNVGQGFKFFTKHYSPELFDFELFEPNPNCVAELRKLLAEGDYGNASINEVALSTKDETLSFFGTDDAEGGEYSQGGSINPDHNNKYYETNDERAITVQAIDFDKYLAEKSTEYDLIAMKLDIEGAENELLEHLIRTGNITKLDVLYVEFHSEYLQKDLRSSERNREKAIIKDMQRLGVRYRLWK